MAGHSKWSQIKRTKAVVDAKRGAVFTRLGREIMVAARDGADPSGNFQLRTAISKAKSAGVPAANIERAIAKGSGQGADGAQLEEVRYEGYGPGGTAVLVDCMTDNRNRTVAEVRHAFSKHGGNLGTSGSVAYLFSKIGVLVYPPESDEDVIMEQALEAGAEDVVTHDDGSIEVTTTPEEYADVKEAMVAAGFEPAMSEITMRASTEAALDFDGAESHMKLIDRLEDLDDVQDVYSNAEISDEIMAKLG